MPRRLQLAFAALALAAIAGSGCAYQVAPAIRVGDLTVTHEQLADELEEWAGNEATQASQTLTIVGTRHGFAQQPASEIIGERIILGLFEDEFERRGLELTQADRDNAFVLIGIDPSQEEQLLGGFSDAYRAEYLERWAKVAAVQADPSIGTDLRSVIGDGADDVELSSRYGTWDPIGFVVSPPPGPSVGASDEPADGSLDPSAP